MIDLILIVGGAFLLYRLGRRLFLVKDEIILPGERPSGILPSWAITRYAGKRKEEP